MEGESRGPGSSPIRGGAVSEDDPKSTRPPSDPGKRLASPPHQSKEETSESNSGSGLERSARGRKRGTEPMVLPTRDSAGSGSDSSAYSSPLREPKAPVVPLCTNEDGTVSYVFTDDDAAVDKYYDDWEKYEAKMARRKLLLTSGRSSVTERYTPKATEAVITYAKSVLTLSSCLDGKVIRCTGIVVEVDAIKNSAVILTSAWIICTKKPLDDWTNKEYDPKAKVNVHMLNGSILGCQLMHFSKHYEIALFEFEFTGSIQLQTLPLESNVEFDQDVFLLARDKDLNLIYKRDKVQLVDPYEHQHNHYQFVNGPIPECGTGGALLDVTGKVTGMLFCTLPLVAFIPSSLILKCSKMWKTFGQLARPHLSLKLGTLGFLGIPRVEFMSRNFSISSGLIVGEISAKCNAEELGIRAGDVILSCQNERVSSIIQLEDVLLSIGEKHLEKSNDLSSKVDVEIGVFHVRKRVENVINLRVDLSDRLEVFHSDDEDAKAEGSKGEQAPVTAPDEAKP
uniref:Uncharacterized protein n=1 Tax=Avena sativa TaxID=4498 RepID=A0ACD5W3R3_AVESA